MSDLARWKLSSSKPPGASRLLQDDDFGVRTLLTGVVVKLKITSPDPALMGKAPERSFVLEGGDRVHIGRSSLNPAKNLTPAKDNAIFGCKVMSRDHAFLEAPTGLPGPLMITDTSKYGTFVNNVRIGKAITSLLKPGDRIKFGDAVSTSSSEINHRPLECIIDYADTDIPESPILTPRVFGNNHFSAEFDSESAYSEDYGSVNEEEMEAADSSSPPDAVEKGYVNAVSETPPFDMGAIVEDTQAGDLRSPTHADVHSPIFAQGNHINSYPTQETDDLVDEYDDFAENESDDGWLEGSEPEMSQLSFPPPPKMARKTRWDMPPSQEHSKAPTSTQPQSWPIKTKPFSGLPTPAKVANSIDSQDMLEQHASSRVALEHQLERVMGCVDMAKVFTPLENLIEIPSAVSNMANSLAGEREDAAAALQDFRQESRRIRKLVDSVTQNDSPKSPLSKRISIDNLIHSGPAPAVLSAHPVESEERIEPNGQSHEIPSHETDLEMEATNESTAIKFTDTQATDKVVDAPLSDAPEPNLQVAGPYGISHLHDIGEESEPIRPRRSDHQRNKKKRKLMNKKQADKANENRVSRHPETYTSPTKTFRSMLGTALKGSAYFAAGSIATIGFLASPMAERLAGF
ncbi:hypothetical protein BDZ85DRAFT_295232 [Elsinoe ampelina]|uniref:FHA domain-containing protein n=1 Tax=Elsinoe ampelina TaxID=302913 RepID=A0A6A6GEP0_9PEZI|nr:hypothetical protein BDZ85DRAFT_295232 [Elsinoe ampelina]